MREVRTLRLVRKRRVRAARVPAEGLVWVYGVLDGRARPATARLPRLPLGGTPRVIPLTTSLMALVADVPADQFGAAALQARLAEPEWVARCAAAHHAVVDRLARSRAVVPFRVLTIFESDSRVNATLAPLQPVLRQAIERIRGRAEWVVRIFRPTAPVQARRRAPATSGAAFLRDRRDARAAKVEQMRTAVQSASAVARELAAIADEHAIRPVEAGGGALVDAAYLVPLPQTSRFRRSLAAFSRELREQGCRVTLTGPWPPYSFVDIGAQPNG